MKRYITLLTTIALLGAGCATKPPESPVGPELRPSAMQASSIRALYVVCVKGNLVLDVRFQRATSSIVEFPVGSQEECLDFFAKRETRQWYDENYAE